MIRRLAEGIATTEYEGDICTKAMAAVVDVHTIPALSFEASLDSTSTSNILASNLVHLTHSADYHFLRASS